MRRVAAAARRSLAGLSLAMAGWLQALPFALDGSLATGLGPNVSVIAMHGSMLVVADGDSGSLTRVDLATGRVLAPVPVGQVPLAIALSADTDTAYVANFRSQDVAVVDLAAGQVLRKVALGVTPRNLVRVGDTLIASGYYEGKLVALGTSADAVGGQLDLSPGLGRIVAHPDARRAYVLNTGRDGIYEIEVTPTLRELSRIEEDLEGWSGWDMELSRDASMLVVSQWGGDRLAVLTTEPLRLRALVPTLGDGPCALALTPDARLAVVAHSESDDAAVVDLERMVTKKVLPVGKFPFSDVEITADGRYALVTADDVRRIAVLDLARTETLGAVAVGRIPHHITAGPEDRFYVSNTGESSVSVLVRTGTRGELFSLLHALP